MKRFSPKRGNGCERALSVCRLSIYGLAALLCLAAPFRAYAQATISSFTPASGPEGTTVTISGTGFTGATAVTFHETPATSFTVASDTSITTSVPTDATTGPISVTTPGGTTESAAIFTVTRTIAGQTVTVHSSTTGTLLPAGALIVQSPFTTQAAPTAGTLLPAGALIVQSPFTTQAAPTAGTLLPAGALIVQSPFTTQAVPTAGTLLPAGALVVQSPFTTQATPTAGILLPAGAVIFSNISFTPPSGPAGTEEPAEGHRQCEGQIDVRHPSKGGAPINRHREHQVTQEHCNQRYSERHPGVSKVGAPK